MNRKTDCLQDLSACIQDARQRAAEQPGVLRHQIYARSLCLLYEDLDELPADHQLFDRLELPAQAGRTDHSAGGHSG